MGPAALRSILTASDGRLSVKVVEFSKHMLLTAKSRATMIEPTARSSTVVQPLARARTAWHGAAGGSAAAPLIGSRQTSSRARSRLPTYCWVGSRWV